MVRKLEESGRVSYLPYKGVDLTEYGRNIALEILRHRRLWEVFLIEKLRISSGEAADLACRMEHFLSPAAADRLSEYLGNPTFTPQGLPIPVTAGDKRFVDLPLNGLGPGESGEIVRLNDDPAVRGFYLAEGLLPGTTLTVKAVSGSGSFLVETSQNRHVYLSADLAAGLRVLRAKPSPQPA
jgi:DtxR family Mn-dependent transcriptional regulator